MKVLHQRIFIGNSPVTRNILQPLAFFNLTKLRTSTESNNWSTIYITGTSDFKEDILKKLEHSELNFMPGYIEDSFNDNLKHDLYWFEENTDLRAVKETITAKLIWKYRLRFYPSLEKFIESQQNPDETSLTEEDLIKIEEIQQTMKR